MEIPRLAWRLSSYSGTVLLLPASPLARAPFFFCLEHGQLVTELACPPPRADAVSVCRMRHSEKGASLLACKLCGTLIQECIYRNKNIMRKQQDHCRHCRHPIAPPRLSPQSRHVDSCTGQPGPLQQPPARLLSGTRDPGSGETR